MVCGSACQLIKIKSRVLFDKEIAQAAKIWSIITKEGCRARGSDAVSVGLIRRGPQQFFSQ
jgi:hypothetical protein